MREDAELYYAGNRGIATLFAGVLVPPAIWFVHLSASFSASDSLCSADLGVVLHLMSLVAVAIAVGAGLLALRNFRDTGEEANPDEGGTLARSKFLAVAGIASSVFFTVVMIATEIPNWMLGPCSS